MKKTLNIIFACLFLTVLACSEETIEVKNPVQDQETVISEESSNPGKKSPSNAMLPGECRYAYPDNCTLYVSCRLAAGGFPQWGFDASTYSAKLSMINTPSGHIPRYGDVAIFNTGTQWGHMAFVEWRDPNTGQIHISETNWNGQDFNWRTTTTTFPGLMGYHRP
ncbi:CHAP domain-containing protein [Fulvivirga sp. 29W222]|uniref:CHAP domain-containing protein n=1 Tax=Fulvivirga marina TaxID=2494733 RepID=A0A937G0V7_9BACT|nr:CHAP domain-containing protein [Fulvivirga marina]MBL6449624.1 CHAP domain-containing protein [Fulvivirga marina]